MSFNKKDGHLDFSNIKMTQLGSSQSIRASFSELNSALRTVKTNTVVKDAYTHFIQELDVNNNPTKVTYYQANKPVIDELFFVADVSSNLVGKYIVLQQFLTKKEVVFYIRVGGVGVAPAVGDIEVAVDIEENDPASIVRLNFINAIKQFEEFDVERIGGYTGTSLQITYLQFGETQMLDVTDTGFFVIRRDEGASFEVGEACIEYDVDQIPIYQGSLLKGMVFNSFAGAFEATGGGGTSDCGPIDFVDELKENDRLKIDIIGTITQSNSNACAYLYQTIEQNNIDNTGVVLELDMTPINTNPAVIDISTTSGEYIFLTSGTFEMELQITGDTQDNARRTSETTLEFFDGVNWVDYNRSPKSFGYHRNNASGENTAYNKVIVSAAASQRFRYTIKCKNNGIIKTVPSGTSLTIKQL